MHLERVISKPQHTQQMRSDMILHCIFARHDYRSGRHTPELLHVIDEYSYNTDPDYFRDNYRDALASVTAGEFESVAMVDVVVDSHQIDLLLNHKPVVVGFPHQSTLTNSAREV